MTLTGPEYGFGLYVHWPYCQRICPYCDFNVYAAKTRDTDGLVDALVHDLHRHRQALLDHPPLNAVFFGGGTPSLMTAEALSKVMAAADETFGLATNCELTLEANPNEVTRDAVETWRALGLSRISLGVQALDDPALTFLGRDHSSTQAREAIAFIAGAFDNYSVDLIYARPGQTIEAWSAELSELLTFKPPHLSLYELTIEAKTAFGKRAARGQLTPMPDDDQADLYEVTQAICDAAGCPAYEVSNHASAPGFRSVHNTIYWRSGDWIGLGPGAHGRLTRGGQRFASEAARRPGDYETSVQAPLSLQSLPDLDVARELLSMGLRLDSGVEQTRLETAFARPLEAETLADLTNEGWLLAENGRLALSREGRLLADAITARLDPT